MCIGWCRSAPSCKIIFWYTEIDADTQRWKGYCGVSLQYRKWLFWLGFQSSWTQASAPQLRFLQLHVNSSKDFSFLGYIILVSSECAQMYRALKFEWFTKNKQQPKKNTKTISLQIHLKSSGPATLVSQLIPNRCPMIVKGTGRSF